MEPIIEPERYEQIATDALAGIRLALPLVGGRPPPRPVHVKSQTLCHTEVGDNDNLYICLGVHRDLGAPSNMISKKCTKSREQLNKELLQAHFMDLSMFDRFLSIEGLKLFFEDSSVMPASQSCSKSSHSN